MGDRNVTRTRLRSGNTRDRRSKDSRLPKVPDTTRSRVASDAPESAAAQASSAASPADALDGAVHARDRDLICEHIQLSIDGLRDALDVIVTAVEALRHQGADLDTEFARVLQRHAGNQLAAEIEQLRVLIRVLEPQRADDDLGIEGDYTDGESSALAA